MTSLRRTFFILAAVLLAAFALPSLGAPGGRQFAKQYYISFAPSTSSPKAVLVHVSNVTQGTGNSTIGSFQLSITSGNAKITNFNNGNPLSKGTASISNGGTTIFFTGVFPIKPATTSDFIINLGDCGDNITWTVDGVWTGSMGQSFAFFQDGLGVPNFTTSVGCDQVGCDGINRSIPSSFYSATVTRGKYDKNGDITTLGCDTVTYTVTLLPGSQKHFFWPTTGTGSDDAAAFLYEFAGTLSSLAWLPISGTPVFIAGQSCAAPPSGTQGTLGVLPAPYGFLQTADTGGATVTVDTTAFAGQILRPAAGINFDVISGTNRLTVNFSGTGPASAEVWNVVARNVGGTSGSLGVAGGALMYTPLPLQSGPYTPTQLGAGYVINDQAQMCIVEQNGTTTKFIDIADGFHAP